MPRFFLWLVLVATTILQRSATSTEDPNEMFSCVGERNSYIDREYCDAVHPDKFRDSASCATCEAAGCECIYEPTNDNCTVANQQSCGQYACEAPEVAFNVGSCYFMDNQQSCESVTGCSWENYEVERPNLQIEATAESSSSLTMTESSSSLTMVGVVVIALLAVGALGLIVAICFSARKRVGTKDTLQVNSQAADIPVASATAINLEDQKNDISK